MQKPNFQISVHMPQYKCQYSYKHQILHGLEWEWSYWKYYCLRKCKIKYDENNGEDDNHDHENKDDSSDKKSKDYNDDENNGINNNMMIWWKS